MLDIAMWIVTIKAYWSELTTPIATLLLVIVGLLYWNVRQERDFYIVRRIAYVRTYAESRTTYGGLSVRAERGKIEYDGSDAFDDFEAARASFDHMHTLYVGEMWQEWEISLLVVRAFTPAQAIRRATARKYPNRPLAKTPFSQILASRKDWAEERKAQLENEKAEEERLQS
jgi:hypothetical protein